MRTSSLCAQALVASAFISLTSLAVAGPLRLITTANSTMPPSVTAGDDSYAPMISADGRYVLFSSSSLDLVSTNPPLAFPSVLNLYLRDRTNGTTTLISLNAAGTSGGNGDSTPIGISTNGQFVFFESSASNLVNDDTNNLSDIFVRDLISGSNQLVSVGFNGSGLSSVPRSIVFTPDGRYVAFSSAATNVVANDTNGLIDVFVRDLQLGTNFLISIGAKSTASSSPTGSSDGPVISTDGRFVAFTSTATNLVPNVGATNEVYLRDLSLGTTVMASASAYGILKTNYSFSSQIVSYNPQLSADGKHLAFASSPSSETLGVKRAIIFRYSIDFGTLDTISTQGTYASATPDATRNVGISRDGRFVTYLANALGTSGTNSAVLVWDATTLSNTVASVNLTNGILNGAVFDEPSLDDSARFVFFVGNATNLTTNLVANGSDHTYVRDLQSNTTTLVDVQMNGAAAGADGSDDLRFSADGSALVYESSNPNIVPNDRNRRYDVFLRNLVTGATELISVHSPGLTSSSPNGFSLGAVQSTSANGRYIAFSSDADNLVSNDTNLLRDVFVRDLLTGSNILISVGTNGFSADGISTDPSISPDGRYVAFTSEADNIVGPDTNKVSDIFVYDLQTGVITQESVGIPRLGIQPNGASSQPVISQGGRFVMFHSKASNLATNGYSVLDNEFLRDRQTSTNLQLTQNGASDAAMTPDGRWIAVGDGYNGGSKLFLKNTSTGLILTNSVSAPTNLVLSADGQQAAYTINTQLFVFNFAGQTNLLIGPAGRTLRTHPRFSTDGRFLTYASTNAQGFSDTNNRLDVYLFDLQTQVKTLVSHAASNATAGNGDSDTPDISADGRFVVYRSQASDLVAGDINDWPDIFLFDQKTGSNSLVSLDNSGGLGGNHWTCAASFSGDGRTLIFPSRASNFIANDFNQTADIFAFTFLYLTVTRGNNPAAGTTISWLAAPEQSYVVQYKENLEDSIWLSLSGTVVIQGNQASIQDNSPNNGHRFYQVMGQ